MVAVLRAEVEELDRSYMNYRERPQLQLIAGIPESFVADPETVSSRRSQSTYWRRRLTCLALVVGAAWLVANVAGDLIGHTLAIYFKRRTVHAIKKLIFVGFRMRNACCCKQC